VSLPSFQLLRPKILDAAVALLSNHADEVKVIAGGTDLLPSMKQKLFTPPYVLDLRGVSELRGIYATPGGGVTARINRLTARPFHWYGTITRNVEPLSGTESSST